MYRHKHQQQQQQQQQRCVKSRWIRGGRSPAFDKCSVDWAAKSNRHYVHCPITLTHSLSFADVALYSSLRCIRQTATRHVRYNPIHLCRSNSFVCYRIQQHRFSIIDTCRITLPVPLQQISGQFQQNSRHIFRDTDV